MPKPLKTLIEVTFYTPWIWTYIHVKDLNFAIFQKNKIYFEKYWERQVTQPVVQARIKYTYIRAEMNYEIQAKEKMETGVK